MRRIRQRPAQAHQHAHAVLLRIGRQQLAEDPGRHFLPFRLRPLPCRGSTGSPPVSAAMRRARRPCSDAGGRSTSVGQAYKDCRRSGATSPAPAGIASTSESALRLRPLRSQGAPAWRMRTPAPPDRNGFRPGPGSWLFSPPASACRSLCSPERIRVLTVPRGSFSRTATSACVNSEKNAASIVCRSSGVRTVKGAPQRLALLLNREDCGIGSLGRGQRIHPLGWTRFFRRSNRNRSMARERAWFMIHPSTVPSPDRSGPPAARRRGRRPASTLRRFPGWP